MNLSTIRRILTPERRQKIYRVAVAIGALLLVYGVAGPEEIEAWLQVVNAALLIGAAGLAERNTNPQK
jgi:hypothetical protein